MDPTQIDLRPWILASIGTIYLSAALTIVFHKGKYVIVAAGGVLAGWVLFFVWASL
jgi:hypothetical protein